MGKTGNNPPFRSLAKNQINHDPSYHNQPHHHPVLRKKRTFGQRAADRISLIVGSWNFIIFVLVMIIIWIFINTLALLFRWDPYPFILLNFVLSCFAALQAPIILMSQNRQAERDRSMAHYDYEVNRKAEREIKIVQNDLEEIKFMVRNSNITPPYKNYKDYTLFKHYQAELEKLKTISSTHPKKRMYYEALLRARQKLHKRKL